MKRLKNCGEAAFLVGTLLLGLATAIVSAAGIGMSVSVAPAYILADAVGVISTGTMCYLWQGFLVILVCVMAGRFKPGFLFTFFAAVIFGASVDFFTVLLFSGERDLSISQRILLFAVGQPVNSLSIAILLNSYLPPQAPELFVKQFAARFRKDVYKVKYGYDICSFILCIVLSLLFFRQLRHIGAGTVISAFANGPLIGLFGKLLCRFVDFSPKLPKVRKFFE